MIEIQPGLIYLCKNANVQLIDWLLPDLDLHLLYEPTTKEITAALDEYADPRQILIIPKGLNILDKKAATTSLYAVPNDEWVRPQRNSYFFILAQDEEAAVKKFYSKLEGKYFYQLDLKTFRPVEHPHDDLAQYPTSLVRQQTSDTLKLNKPIEVVAEMGMLKELLSVLGTAKGITTWRNMSDQAFNALFIAERPLLCKADKTFKVSTYAESALAFNSYKHTENEVSGSSYTEEFGICTYLAYYLKPFIEIAQKTYSRYPLGVFASWVYFTSTTWKKNYNLGFESKSGKFNFRPSPQARIVWSKLIVALRQKI